MKNLFALFCAIFIQFNLFAAKVDTVLVYSEAMNKEIKTVVILPDEVPDELPTLYLLHGYSGNYADWVNKAPHIKDLVDTYKYMVVCPDGGYGSWYWDVEGDANYQYETFISKELIAYMEQHYPVSKGRDARAITGLSMGGHGALYLAFRNQEVFGAAGSTAGGVDFRPFPDNWEIKDRLGDYSDSAEKWENHTVINLLHLYKPNKLKLFVDCGTADFFYGVNESLHEKMNYLNIPHHYLTLPGKHDWAYWNKSIVYQMSFFNSFFTAD